MSTIVPTYEGNKSRDERLLRHGKGTYSYQYDGFVYDGEWVDGIKQGSGKLILPDGISQKNQHC